MFNSHNLVKSLKIKIYYNTQSSFQLIYAIKQRPTRDSFTHSFIQPLNIDKERLFFVIKDTFRL